MQRLEVPRFKKKNALVEKITHLPWLNIALPDRFPESWINICMLALYRGSILRTRKDGHSGPFRFRAVLQQPGHTSNGRPSVNRRGFESRVSTQAGTRVDMRSRVENSTTHLEKEKERAAQQENVRVRTVWYVRPQNTRTCTRGYHSTAGLWCTVSAVKLNHQRTLVELSYHYEIRSNPSKPCRAWIESDGHALTRCMHKLSALQDNHIQLFMCPLKKSYSCAFHFLHWRIIYIIYQREWLNYWMVNWTAYVCSMYSSLRSTLHQLPFDSIRDQELLNE
jgi:hypothetical protein